MELWRGKYLYLEKHESISSWDYYIPVKVSVHIIHSWMNFHPGHSQYYGDLDKETIEGAINTLYEVFNGMQFLIVVMRVVFLRKTKKHGSKILKLWKKKLTL